MKRILLLMSRKMLAESLKQALDREGKTGFERVFLEFDFRKARASILATRPEIIVVEAPEDPGAMTRLTGLLNDVRDTAPGARVILLLSEHDMRMVALADRMKRAGRIRDYVFYDASTQYLIAKIRAC